MPERFRTVFNKNTSKMEDVSGNIFKHVLGNNSLQHHNLVVYDFETMII